MVLADSSQCEVGLCLSNACGIRTGDVGERVPSRPRKRLQDPGSTSGTDTFFILFVQMLFQRTGPQCDGLIG